MTKVIIVNRYFYPDMSATSQMATDLAFHLAGSGREVTVATSRLLYEDPDAILGHRESVNNVNIVRIWSTRFGRTNLIGRAVDYASFYLSAFFTMFALTKRGDVVIAKTDPPLISAAVLIPVKLKGAKLVNWLQDIFPDVAMSLGMLKPGLLTKFAGWLRDMSLRNADMNVAIGDRMLQRLADSGSGQYNTTVIYNWSDSSLVSPLDHEHNILRKEWGLDDKFVIAYSGNMGRAHDFETVIEAASMLKGDDRLFFLFIGGGAGKANLETKLKERGVRNYRFLPYQDRDRLSESLSAADTHLVSLIPALEGLIVPSKIYGILAAGRPVLFIGDPEGDIGKLVSRYRIGASIKPGDSKKLANTVSSFSRDPKLVSEMCNRCRDCLLSKFDKRFAMEKWQKTIDSIM